jgi:hypothetical protein
MNMLELASLQRAQGAPSISLLAPMDGAAAGPSHGLAGLITEAERRLRLEFPEQEVRAYVERLQVLADRIEASEGRRGVAIFVNDDLEQIVDLPVSVRRRVVIDETFATRDLVRALQRSVRYRVLTLDERVTRLYEGAGTLLTELRGDALPFLFREEEAERDNRPSADPTRLSRYVHQLEAAIEPHVRDDPVPVILAGAEPRLGAVRRARLGGAVLATIPTQRDRPDVTELARAVMPHVEALHAARVADGLSQLATTPPQLFASGVGDAWYVAGQGRGALLMVEESFEFPARLDPKLGAVAPAEDRDEPGVVDDLVDEVIELVLAKRGRCVVVPDGTLSDFDRVVLTLRY